MEQNNINGVIDEETLPEDAFDGDEETGDDITADSLYGDLNISVGKLRYLCRKITDDVKALGAELDEKIAADVIDMNNIGDILAGLEILRDCIDDVGLSTADVYTLVQATEETTEDDE